MYLPHFLLLSSDATRVGIAGGAFLLLAGFALLAEWQRGRRKHVDRVGCMPWTLVFLVSSMLGAGLIVAAVQGWLAG